VVVIGCGRVGQLLCDVFTQQHVPYLGIEHDVERVSALRARGAPVFYGNATRPELLGKLGLDRAACLVVTMDQPASARRVVSHVRQAHPQLPIFARSHDERHAHELRAAGATMVVPETLEAGLLLTGRALGALGVQPPERQAIVQAERERRLSVDRAA
jgi:CPA2 family monovalent cation:H+ antiporter-2